MVKVEKDLFVSVEYTGTLENGETFDIEVVGISETPTQTQDHCGSGCGCNCSSDCS